MNRLRASFFIYDDMIHAKSKQNHAESKQNKFCLDNTKHRESVLYEPKKTLAKQTKQNWCIGTIQKNFKTKFFFYSVLQILLGCLVLVDKEVLEPP